MVTKYTIFSLCSFGMVKLKENRHSFDHFQPFEMEKQTRLNVWGNGTDVICGIKAQVKEVRS